MNRQARDRTKRRKQHPRLLLINVPDLANILDACGMPVRHQAQQIGQAGCFIVAGGDVQQPGHLIAGLRLAIFGQIPQQSGTIRTSNAFVPTSSMPDWLRVFADHQPISVVIGAVRGLLLNQPDAATIG